MRMEVLAVTTESGHLTRSHLVAGRIGVIGGRDLSHATDSLKAGMAGEVRAEQGRNRR